jgi:hypothetical protein
MTLHPFSAQKFAFLFYETISGVSAVTFLTVLITDKKSTNARFSGYFPDTFRDPQDVHQPLFYIKLKQLSLLSWGLKKRQTVIKILKPLLIITLGEL